MIMNRFETDSLFGELDSRPFGFAQGRLCAGMTTGYCVVILFVWRLNRLI